MKTSLAHDFLGTAQRLGDQMLLDLKDRDPQFAAAVAHAFTHGHRLQVALVIGTEPAIEMQLVDDYGKQRRVCSIPCAMPEGNPS